MTEKKKRETKEEAKVTFDLGFGGLFKGLGDFIDLLGDMIETGEEEVTRTGEFRVKGLGDKGRGVYGFSVRTGVGGVPRVERFGNIRATEEGPVVAEVREPLVDVFDEEQEIVIAAELPGVAEEEVHIEIQDDILSLETTGERKYAKEILLPEPVDAATLQKAYKNGILELRLKKAKAEE
ncbi:MAG: Hsp20/alpha crystallin family protein [Chloroflexi bacterium]|nr:Hsp20/alpha crystallin family protein [Chloroflexota bacterium]